MSRLFARPSAELTLAGFVCLSLLVACSGSGDGGTPITSPPSPPPPPSNSAPVISGSPAVTVLIGDSYDFLPTASDPDGDDLTFSIAGAPPWIMFDAASGHLFGDPTEADEGTYDNITISVSDADLAATLGPFSIAVERPAFGLLSRPSNTSCLAVPPPDDAEIDVQRVFPNLALNEITALTQAPGDSGAWYFTTRDGLIGRFDNTPAVNGFSVVLDMRSTTHVVADGGLIQLVFHPDFPADRRIFVNYSRLPQNGVFVADTYISSFRLSADGMTIDATSEIVRVRQPRGRFHQGGFLSFDDDGHLLIGFGDGTGQGDPWGRAQNLRELRGKILRIDIDQQPYAIPPDNPFVDSGTTARSEIFAYGVRNPWRGDIDPQSGKIYVADVGYLEREEVSEVFAGANLGWNIREGTSCHSEQYGSCDDPGLVEPIIDYAHVDGNCAIIGGYFYRGTAIPQLQGQFVFGDFCSGKISTIDVQSGRAPTEKILLPGGAGISFVNTFARDNDGELYAVTSSEIFKLVPSGTGSKSPGPPSRLSETGCFDAADPTIPASGVIPYDLNTPLWSDGAEKRRWIALPDDRMIDLLPDGDFDFPEGTVLVKEFSIAGEPVETRLLMHDVGGTWSGYSYEWVGDDAYLLSGGKTKTLSNGQVWQYPSRGECLRCHTDAANVTLGPEIAQLNTDFHYAETNYTANQLATFLHIGLLANGLPLSPEDLPATAPIDADHQALSRRARSYLHSNCSGCHRREGPTQSSMDLRFMTNRADMNVCNVDPALGDIGISGAKLLSPGQPDKSLLVQRPASANPLFRMPPLGTSIVHAEAIAILDAWIRTANVCAPESDTDLDTVPDDADNCPDVKNTSQLDRNRNGVGDACE